jgi:hypothetical protein
MLKSEHSLTIHFVLLSWFNASGKKCVTHESTLAQLHHLVDSRLI